MTGTALVVGASGIVGGATAALYLRVSTDEQDLARQEATVAG